MTYNLLTIASFRIGVPSILFFLGILISKQIAPASLFSFQLRIKTPFRKNITDDAVILFAEVKCKGNTQITHMEETEKRHRVIRLILVMKYSWSNNIQFFQAGASIWVDRMGTQVLAEGIPGRIEDAAKH